MLRVCVVQLRATALVMTRCEQPSIAVRRREQGARARGRGRRCVVAGAEVEGRRRRHKMMAEPCVIAVQ